MRILYFIYEIISCFIFVAGVFFMAMAIPAFIGSGNPDHFTILLVLGGFMVGVVLLMEKFLERRRWRK